MNPSSSSWLPSPSFSSSSIEECSVDELLFRARLAEHSHRWHDLCFLMRKIVERRCPSECLSEDERSLLSLSYKELIAERRSAWRLFYQIETKYRDQLKKERAVKEKEKHRTEKNIDEKNTSDTEPPSPKPNTNQNNHNHSSINNVSTRESELSSQIRQSHIYREVLQSELEGLCAAVLDDIDRYLLPSIIGIDDSGRFFSVIESARSFVNPSNKSSLISSFQSVTSIEAIEESLKNSLNGSLESLIQKIRPNKEKCEALVFYTKMYADYRRYLSEIAENESGRVDQALSSLAAFYLGLEIAKITLFPNDPIRLAVAFNLSVFYFEVMAVPDRACQIAKTAFDDALVTQGGSSVNTSNSQGLGLSADNNEPEKTSLDHVIHKQRDALQIMNLLKSNLSLWTNST